MALIRVNLVQMITGYNPQTLREIVDERAVQARLVKLGESRSTAALGEKAELLRMLGRLDESLAMAEQAFRLSYFGGDREDLTRARLRRAQVFQHKGQLQHALTEMVASRATSAVEGWESIEALAAHFAGTVLFELGRFDEAKDAFADALTIRVRIDAPASEVESSRFALGVTERAVAADG